ncbi:hypothetical protein C6503_10770 [Candidatus Poribacteria bacterium]|nr:MAG: hypothetical protein C6503_10770 [Candidatus Poribacteria bacterium]
MFKEKKTVNKWKCLLFILVCLSQISCAALLTKQQYVLIDRPVDGMVTFHGEVYWLPESADIRKIALLGSGQLQNFEIHVRDEKRKWELVKKVPGGRLPFEIPLTAETDAVKIIKLSRIADSRIETIQFYTVAEKRD